MNKVLPTQGTCQHCKKVFVGRSDKKFCNGVCRSALHNRIARARKKRISILPILKVPLPEFESPITTPPAAPVAQMFLRYITVKLHS
jgi:hypothetical protein